MRRIVTHKSSDLDAIASVWLLKRFYPDWDGAEVEFVSAGDRLPGEYKNEGNPIELVDGVETIHVDTGMGALDHHQTSDNNTCGAKLTLDFILKNPESNLHKHEVKKEAVERIVELVIDDDHFQEVYYPDSNKDIYALGIVELIQGHKLMFQKDDAKLVNFIMECLDVALHSLETRIWAEEEINKKGIEFTSKWGKSLAIETINDEVLKLSQMRGYVLAVRKDPNGGFIRIKALPDVRSKNEELGIKNEEEKKKQDLIKTIDLTPYYKKLKKMDPDASWFLHASKRMLLNGSSKNPTMNGTKLTLSQVVEVLQNQ